MYISAAYHFEPKANINRTPRERYFDYYRDLHARYKVPLDESTFYGESQYKFTELGYPLFEQAKEEGNLEGLDLMVATYWAHEFDPDLAACGPHFAYKYGFDCNMFDVLDQGSISSVTALKIISSYMQSAGVNKALLFSLDQSGIPLIEAATISKPSRSCGAALVLQKTDASSNLFIKDIKILTEQQCLEKQLDIIPYLLEMIEGYGISYKDLSLCIKRDAATSKVMSLFENKYDRFIDEITLINRKLQKGCTDVLEFMANIATAKRTISSKYMLVIEEDVESLTTGVLLLEQVDK